ncbi:DNA-binding response OmpR family regulator [Pseudochelatococcus lubricantis]|uniref:DNA-binding response OmpR family regulator n=1 Tax=Pseudochelatococcus lubricantis TaxID=1538102 RepID=A0ABX0V5S1_9HYPH|nr:response regulator [Pseudochelatococcus lubricantis]NIJ59849.1 DNA-binding response OmpR family regulator [Pseudochelatococcus lubricantis]
MRILLVEDDDMIARALTTALGSEGFSVDHVASGELALEALQSGGHGVALLDLGLPEIDGLDVLARARRSGVETPIIVVTARDALESRIHGLDIGADDYIVKPFEVSELSARIRAVLRRHAGKAVSRLDAGEVSLDLASHTVFYRGLEAMLPSREFALVQALVERPGMIFSRDVLEEKLYGWGEEVESNAIDVLIYYVRKKFDKDIIRNVRGAGWMIPR